MKYFIILLLLSSCAHTPTKQEAASVLSWYTTPDLTKPIDWGLAEERYNNGD